MNKQEAIEQLEEKKSSFNAWEHLVRNRALDDALDIVRKLDEPEKPVVPQYVADFYEDIKDSFEWSLHNLCIDFHKRELQEDLYEWFKYIDNNPIETLVKMKLYGYEVEKEQLYTVEIPNPNHEDRPILFKKRDGKVSIIFPSVPCWRTVKNAQLTEQEIKEDFGWAWQFAKEVKE